jgi:hypothetical protein
VRTTNATPCRMDRYDRQRVGDAGARAGHQGLAPPYPSGPAMSRSCGATGAGTPD